MSRSIPIDKVETLSVFRTDGIFFYNQEADPWARRTDLKPKEAGISSSRIAKNQSSKEK
ncbi:hypothetical protein [Leptospira santarosai]|uniref:hypothetical protein n=1 Tax=Leptospira santarosai TaxID=28183 RepID=UPI0024AF175C|nr:hypothetical protein [Leptospira santarosai]MDI7164687.1 hypothetical protein [Leptospira santarosai]